MRASSVLLNDHKVRLRALEKGWNDKISKDRESKRLVAMSEDIREFIANSMLGDNKAALQEQKNALESSMGSIIDGQMPSPVQQGPTQDVSPLKTSKSTSGSGLKKNKKTFDKRNTGMHSSMGSSLDLKQEAFETIANTLNYKHQDGTDYDTELRILKCVMTRESQLLKLKHLIDNSEITQPHADGTTSIALKENIGLKILEELLHIRNVTLDYLENLHQWRVSAPKLPNANLDGPRVFLWEGYNYTMKVVSDLDFLADREVLVTALGQNPDKMRGNPLMLQATLEEGTGSWVDPALQASYDANNTTSGPLYEERLRLRNAERLLLVEIEYNAAYIPDNEEQEGNMSPNLNGEPESLWPNSSNNNNIVDSNDDMKGKTWQEQMSEEIKSLAIDNMSQENRPESKNSTRAESRRGLGTSGSRSNLVGDIGPTEPGENTNQNYGGGIAFLQFDGVEEQVMPLEGDMQQYNAYLTGNNILPPIDNFDASNMPFDSERIDNDVLLRFSNSEDDISTKMSIASSLTIDSVSMYDLEVIININTPPRSIMLAGAICVILLTEGKTLPTNVSWEGFRELVIAKNQTLASSMNTLDPRGIPKFKLRAIKPFMEKLTLIRSQLDTITGAAEGSMQDQLSDVLGSIASTTSLGLDVPLEAVESVERLFRWTRQVYNATEKGKKRRKVKGVEKDIQEKNSKTVTKAGGSGKVVDKNVRAKAEQQKMRTGRMAQGKTGTIRKKKNHVAAMELWPVHTEILENVFKHPLLLTILSSQQSGFNQSSAHVLKLRKQILQYDPLNIAGRGVDVPPERVVAKIYNLVDSKEATININIRDYTLYLYQLREKYSHDAVEYFQPASVIWWVQNLRNLIQVRQKVNKNLVFMISKQAIERHVTRAMGIYDNKSVDASLSMPLSGISMPASLPSEVKDQLNNIQRNPNVSNNNVQPNPDNELNLNDWDFYESDFVEDETMDMGDISSPVNQPLSRQEMREQFMQQQAQQQQKQQQHMYTQREIEEARLLQLQQQEQLQRQRSMEMPEATDFGEDVFEDDGEGEFEAEVDRATQLSRTISREKPLSAPGSLSAPHSFASNPTDAINNSIPNLSAGAGRNANYNQGQSNSNNNNQDYDDYDDGGYASDKAVEQTDNKADSGGDSIASEEEVTEINISDTTNAPVVAGATAFNNEEVVEEEVAEVADVTDKVAIAKDNGTVCEPPSTVTDLALPSTSIDDDENNSVAESLGSVIDAIITGEAIPPEQHTVLLASPSQSTISDTNFDKRLKGESSILTIEGEE